jgi:methylenetetrahydrofolate dehydrogenase (NADP+)/methenyltetrahydrofolate cyclohydrolase
MTARIIDGKALAAALGNKISAEVERLRTAHGLEPGLAVVLAGNDPASEIYVRSKTMKTAAAGMRSSMHKLPETVAEADLLALIDQLNRDAAVHGILVQLPLPKHIDETKVLLAVDPDKDVDGFHPINVGRLAAGARDQALVPCTPAGSVILAKEALGGDLSGLEAVVIGRSNIVGKPVAQLLLQEHCTVTIAHSRTRDLPAVCRRADLLVAAVGRAEMVKGDWIKPGACVIDVGINRVADPATGKSRLVGDVDFASAAQVAGDITPVPGGVGPMTIALLMANTVTAAARAAGRPDLAAEIGRV